MYMIYHLYHVLSYKIMIFVEKRQINQRFHRYLFKDKFFFKAWNRIYIDCSWTNTKKLAKDPIFIA